MAEDTRAGSYVLEGEISRGGFGVVYRARHEVTARPAAVKVQRRELAADATAVSRFEREIGVLLRLSHPHISEIHEHGRLHDGRPYFAMELLFGATLEQHLGARGRLSIGEVLAILAPLSEALDAAHAQGIVHRDLKPSNVFLADDRPRGRVVLLDFGVAKLRAGTALTGPSDLLGTLLYMAPEQFGGDAVDARADVYALGALAYAMLTGEPPFAEQIGQRLRLSRPTARPSPPSARAPIDPALDAPILRALDRDPARRTTSAGALVAELAAAASGPAPEGAPRGATLRATLALFAEVRVDPALIAAGDESWITDAEAALPIVSSELYGAGLVVVRETARTLLLVDVEPGDPARASRVLAAAARAHQRFVARRPRVALAVTVHAGTVALNAEGALAGGGLLDVASWVPAAPAGVIASSAALVKPGGRDPVPAAPGFYWIAR